MTQAVFDFEERPEYIDRLFRWKAFDNRLLCILKDEHIQGDEVSCFTELNEDFSIKMRYNETYGEDVQASRFLPMEDVEEILG